MTYRIQTFNHISKEGLERFSSNGFLITDHPQTQDPHAILVRSQGLHAHNFEPSLLAVGRAGAGVNNIPVDKLTEKGVVVFNTPGANANGVKELVLGAMFMSARHLGPAYRYVLGLKEGSENFEEQVEKGKKQFSGSELLGKTLGIVGLGAIGTKVAHGALGLGMKVIGYDPWISIKQAWQLSSSVQQAHDLNEVLETSDFVTFHIPLSEQTKGLIGHEQLSKMKPEAVLLNFSRAQIINHGAVKEALDQHRLVGYVSDFPHPDLIHCPKNLHFPHLGASTAEAEVNCAKMIVDQVRDFLLYGHIVNGVNFPNVHMPWTEGYRLAIMNHNIPNMVGQISTLLAKKHYNVIQMMNQSKGHMAYTLLDLNQPVTQDLVQELSHISGVAKVRLVGG